MVEQRRRAVDARLLDMTRVVVQRREARVRQVVPALEHLARSVNIDLDKPVFASRDKLYRSVLHDPDKNVSAGNFVALNDEQRVGVHDAHPRVVVQRDPLTDGLAF